MKKYVDKVEVQSYGGSMNGQRRNSKYTPLVKFASIVASAILVLNLLPVQGIAEARDELANIANQPA